MFDLALKTLDDQEETGRIYEFEEQNGSVFLTGGLRMLLQTWAKHFLTETGTHPVDPQYGTAFPRLINGNVESETQVFMVIDEAVSKTNRFIEEVQRQNDVEDPDFLLKDGSLDNINVQRDGTNVEATVVLENQSGDRLQVFVRDLEVLTDFLNQE